MIFFRRNFPYLLNPHCIYIYIYNIYIYIYIYIYIWRDGRFAKSVKMNKNKQKSGLTETLTTDSKNDISSLFQMIILKKSF